MGEGVWFHQYGGIGEYSRTCESGDLELEACYARCNCWTDFPDLGGEITHEVDAQCLLDTCFCSYDQVGCPYGTLKTNPFCCSRNAGWGCDEFTCDTDGECIHTGKLDQLRQMFHPRNFS